MRDALTPYHWLLFPCHLQHLVNGQFPQRKNLILQARMTATIKRKTRKKSLKKTFFYLMDDFRVDLLTPDPEVPTIIIIHQFFFLGIGCWYYPLQFDTVLLLRNFGIL